MLAYVEIQSLYERTSFHIHLLDYAINFQSEIIEKKVTIVCNIYFTIGKQQTGLSEHRASSGKICLNLLGRKQFDKPNIPS